jgi:NADPH-dependent 2,4-dienoyl-CoA reductase/sulfur reductase-like enzyme
VEEVDVVGEITAGASAATGLRRLVKKSEEEVVGGVEVPDIKVDVEDVEPPDGQSACLWYRVQLFMISLR